MVDVVSDVDKLDLLLSNVFKKRKEKREGSERR